MEIIIKGEPKEIADLVVKIQSRQAEGVITSECKKALKSSGKWA